MIARQPTPQGISSLLKRAGFERSVSSATRIKGWRNNSEGYRCEKSYGIDGGVLVRHYTGFDRGEAAHARRDEELARYAEAIKAAGWAAYRTETGPDGLLVTANPDAED